MRTAVVIFVAVVAGGVFGFLAGQAHTERQGEALALAHALEKTVLCANTLNTITGSGEAAATRMLDQQLRLALVNVDRYSAAAPRIQTMVPKMVDALRRAARYAESINDRELAARISALETKIRRSLLAG